MDKINYSKPKKLFNPQIKLDFNKFANELTEAQYSLGLLEGSQRKLHNPSLLISPLTTKEATVSSKIEGTQSTVSDVFLYDAGGIIETKDTKQVINYRATMNFAIEELDKSRPLSMHLIKTMHGILLDGVRHKGEIGKFRDDKVWIAKKDGDPIEKAIYVPPEHVFVDEYIEDLFQFINKGKENALVKAGVVHYQFEAVHPFTDGNGRIGRLLIPLILHYQNKLTQPILYISGYFEEHREEYIDALHEVDTTGDYSVWLAFYFKSVSEQLKETQKLIDFIYQLYDDIKNKFGKTKSPFMDKFIDFVFKNPYFTIPLIEKEIGVSTRVTATNLIKLFESANLVEKTAQKKERAKIYKFKPLLDIL